MIVLDASVVVSAALLRGAIPDLAFRAALEGRAGVAMSRAVIAEMAGVLLRPRLGARLPPGRADEVLELLLHRGTLIEPTVRVADGRDDKDNKYPELALAAGASGIISGDADLLVLDPWRGVRILTPAAFLEAFPLT